jgi:hypothetical protein
VRREATYILGRFNSDPKKHQLPRLLYRPEQVQMAYAKCNGDFVKSDDRGVSMALFQTTNVLLAEPRNIGELLLRLPPFLPETPDVSPDQSAHVHAQKSADYAN